jgi:hypothetical protein
VICSAGAVCGQVIWQKPTSTRLVCTPRMDGAAQAGGEPIGIGIRGLTPSLSFQVTGFSIARSAGVSILRGGYIRLRSSGTDTGTADTDTDAGTVTITITSVQTRVTGDPALTMSEDVVMPTASIAERDRQEGDSIPDQ